MAATEAIARAFVFAFHTNSSAAALTEATLPEIPARWNLTLKQLSRVFTRTELLID